jgi:flavodoxin
MNPCVVYFSRTGNTKRFAQAIADAVKAPIFDLALTQPSALADFDMVIFGTPVEGSNPTKEAVAFIEGMPKVEGKKAIVFCTNRLFGAGRTTNIVEKMLVCRGYETVAKMSKKGMKPDKEADFTREVAEVKKALVKP